MGRVSRKRRYSETGKKTANDGSSKNSQKSNSQGRSTARKKLEISIEVSTTLCERCLTCGSGEQLGHPGRQTTRKPRAVDTFDENVRFVQACAGGVHSLLLTDDGKVYSCGANEKGVVPVKGLEAGDVTDSFTEIEFSPSLQSHGKVVQITAGGSFAAALTELGSVIAWGNLRDSQGDVTAHPHFEKMHHEPIIIIRYNKVKIVKIAAGENHLVMLSSNKQVYTYGEGSQGQLGRLARPGITRQSFLADDSGCHLLLQVLERNKLIKFVDIFAGSNWTILKDENERLFGFGLNNFGQLGTEPSQPHDSNAEGNGTVSQVEAKDEGKYNIMRPKLIPTFASDSKWTHISGATHIVFRNEKGEVYAVGKNVDNYLGIGSWTGKDDTEHWRYHTLQKVVFPVDVKIAGVAASLGCTIAWTEDGDAYSFGFDSAGQLGLGIKDDDEDKIVATPKKITSLHLDDYKIVQVSLADQHAIFIAKHA